MSIYLPLLMNAYLLLNMSKKVQNYLIIWFTHYLFYSSHTPIAFYHDSLIMEGMELFPQFSSMLLLLTQSVSLDLKIISLIPIIQYTY